MLDSTSLREALKTIFGIEDRYLVPLDQGWYVPTYDTTDRTGTWIGYRILSKKPIARTYQDDRKYIKSIKVQFRLAFVGLDAEKLADQTLLWDDRKDVTDAFYKSYTQLNYISRQQFTYPVQNGGLNDNLCWCVDFSAQTFYCTEAQWDLWKPKEVFLGGNIITGGLNG